jgi:hypothetical protein
LFFEASPLELQEKRDQLVKALIEQFQLLDPDLSEVLEKALPHKEPALKYRAMEQLRKKTREEYVKTLDKMVAAIGEVLDQGVQKPSKLKKAEIAAETEEADEDADPDEDAEGNPIFDPETGLTPTELKEDKEKHPEQYEEEGEGEEVEKSGPGPIAIGKRGGNIYGYDSKGNPIYKKPKGKKAAPKKKSVPEKKPTGPLTREALTDDWKKFSAEQIPENSSKEFPNGTTVQIVNRGTKPALSGTHIRVEYVLTDGEWIEDPESKYPIEYDDEDFLTELEQYAALKDESDQEDGEDQRVDMHIRRPDPEDALYLAAESEFGLTDDPAEAGYIMPDGGMLDFSEKREGGPPGQRSLDHRAIASAFSEAGIDVGDEYSEGMMQFIYRGNVRLGYYPNPKGVNEDSLNIDFGQRPTEAQERIIARLIKQSNEVAVDVELPGGRTESFSFSGQIRPHEVFRKVNGAFAMAGSMEKAEAVGQAKHVNDVFNREQIAYDRVKAVLQRKGYEPEDFEEGGVLYGYSVNELIEMAKPKLD